MKLKSTPLTITPTASVIRLGAHAVMLLFALAILPTASFAAAGGVKAARASVATAGSCNNASSGFCNEFTGSSYKVERVKRSCQAGKGVAYLAGACPTEGRIGTCIVYKGKSSESKYRYYKNFPGFGIKPAGGVTLAAKNQCTDLKGEWIPN